MPDPPIGSPPTLVGRPSELKSLSGFLDGIQRGPQCLLLDGEPGIGKTTLWGTAVADARRRAFTVLTARPTGSEVQLSFAGLGDVLAPVLAEELPALPPTQRRALEGALQLTARRGPPADRRLLGLALLSILQGISRRAPVLVAIDDLQWLDGPSGQALGFALRRVGDEPVGLLATLRDPSGGVPFELDRAVSHEQFRLLHLGPLSVAALHEILSARLGASLRRRTLLRVHETAGGNPFYAMELARVLVERGGTLAVGEEVVVPESLRTLVGERLAALPGRTRELLLAAAALSQPTLVLLATFCGDERRAAAELERAELAGVIDISATDVRFTHPLLAAVCYGDSSTRARRSVHRRLAAVVRDPEERARHLALAADGPDAQVAHALDGAADAAQARGAPEAAAQLAADALHLTPPVQYGDLQRRRLAAAKLHVRAGDPDAARRLLEQAADDARSALDRARALWQLGTVLEVVEGMASATAIYEQALAEADGDEALQAEIHLSLSELLFALQGVRAAEPHARISLELAGRVDDTSLFARALMRAAEIAFLLGRGIQRESLERAVVIEESGEYIPVAKRPSLELASEEIAARELDCARLRLERLCETARRSGDVSIETPLFYLSAVELYAGNWESARALADEAIDAAEAGGQEALRRQASWLKGVIEAHRGEVDAARAHIGLLAADEQLDAHYASAVQRALGFIELSLGRLPEARGHLDTALELSFRGGIEEPGLWQGVPDAIEALSGTGELARAAELIDRLEERGRAVDRVWVLMTAARCRGLLEAARDELDAAEAACEHALAEYRRLPSELPFELGRNLLALGFVRRRRRRKRAARESLEGAHAIFERLGARLWAEKARSELARIGGRTPHDAELSETERLIVDLVAAGRTNRDVAEALSLSPKTVAWNLSKVYRKLGVRSRTELAALVAPNQRP